MVRLIRCILFIGGSVIMAPITLVMILMSVVMLYVSKGIRWMGYLLCTGAEKVVIVFRDEGERLSNGNNR